MNKELPQIHSILAPPGPLPFSFLDQSSNFLKHSAQKLLRPLIKSPFCEALTGQQVKSLPLFGVLF